MIYQYAIRITNENQDVLKDYIRTSEYVIGNMEIGENGNRHYHSVFSSTKKINNLRNILMRRNIIQRNKYSLTVCKKYVESISYAIKEGVYSTNMDLSHIPNWVPKEEFNKVRTTFTYTQMVAGYQPLESIQIGISGNITQEGKKKVIKHVLDYVIDNWYGKLFSDDLVKKYVDSIIHEYYYIRKSLGFFLKRKERLLISLEATYDSREYSHSH